MMKFIKKNWLLIFLIIISAFTRFYRLPATVTFLEDEGRDVLIEHRIISGKLVALGPQTSTGNMYLGPFYYYFTAPALLLAGGNPLGPIYLIALTGVFTTYLLFIYVSAWFGKKAGFVSALLFAIMPAVVYMNRNSWNPNLIPLFSLLYVKLIDNLSGKKNRLKDFFLLGIIAGILVQLHYMVLLLIFVSGIYLIYIHRKNFIYLIKGILIALVGFLIPLIPFIFFEFRNNFVNSQAIFKFILAKDEHNIRYSVPLQMFFDKVKESTWRLFSSLFGKGQVTKLDPLTPFLSIGFILMTLFGLKGSKNIYKLLVFFLFGSLIALGIYQENVHLHYLGFLFPIVMIIAGSWLDNKSKIFKFAVFIYLLVAIIYGGNETRKYIISGPGSQLIRAKDVAEYIVKKADGRPYNAVPFRDTQMSTPFAYFLSISSNPPKENLQSLLYVICVDRPCDQSDLNFEKIFRKGPAHPSLAEYLGHPFIDTFTNPIEFVSMEHVSHGVWVGETSVKLSL